MSNGSVLTCIASIADTTDGVVVTGAVQGIIHAMPFGVGHLGSGKVTLDCQNLEAISEEAK